MKNDSFIAAEWSVCLSIIQLKRGHRQNEYWFNIFATYFNSNHSEKSPQSPSRNSQPTDRNYTQSTPLHPRGHPIRVEPGVKSSGTISDRASPCSGYLLCVCSRHYFDTTPVTARRARFEEPSAHIRKYNLWAWSFQIGSTSDPVMSIRFDAAAASRHLWGLAGIDDTI